MEVVHTILTVLFIFVSLILITLILLQNNRSSGASLFGGGGNQSAFGAGSADILTKMTAVLVASFVVLAMLLAFLRSRSTNVQDLQKEFQKQSVPETMHPSIPPSGSDSNETKQPATNEQGTK